MERFLVSASTGAMGSLLGKLGTMLSDEYKLLKDVHGDIKFLKDELEAMHAFLIMMADEEKPDHQSRLRADAVREMSYEIEDSIDKFMLLVDRGSSCRSDGFKNVFSQSMKKIIDIKTRHKIAKDVKGIMSQVMVISERYGRYTIGGSSRQKHEKVDPRICSIYKDALELVGIDGPRDELMNWLSNKEGELTSRPKVLSIVGYGGLGKTTLAKQVYEKLGADYECQAFVSISRNPDMNKIFSSILCQLQKCDYAQAGDAQFIIDRIRNYLKDKRYCIIIDDVWDVETWKALDCTLIRNGCGSVIITTTRIHSVAKSCCSSEVDFVYKIQPLGPDDSKKLFFSRIFGCEENCPPNLKQASEDILRRCGGLPLAINAISSLLATGKTKEEWDRVRSSIGFAQGKSSAIDSMNYILSLSYFDLPLYLRSCLLYLTMFPEDSSIGREQLVYRWIYEGLIHSEDGENLVDLGESYFYELANRSLIQPTWITYDGKAECCRVHDTVLDFLIYKSTEENFCTFLSNNPKAGRKVRSLSLMPNEDQGSVEQLDLSHARSLGAFGSSQKYFPSLLKANALRVLDLFACHSLGNHHVKDIGKLSQLRYLNIFSVSVTELPREIGDLAHLEMLDVSNTKVLELPETFTRLKRLARLFVADKTKLSNGIGNMKNLQDLGLINVFMQPVNFAEDLGKLTNLTKLRIVWDSYESNASYEETEKLVSSLCKLDSCKLRLLRIEFRLTLKDATLIGQPFFPALNSIQDIEILVGQLCWIYKWLISLVNLETLVIQHRMTQVDADMVGSLPSLVEFSAYFGCLEPITINRGFQRLKKFVFMFNLDVLGLMFEAGAMPNLERLDLRVNLPRLDYTRGSIDIGIQHLSSLAWLRVSIICEGGRAADVEAAEREFRNMVETHPNRPTLVMRRYEQ